MTETRIDISIPDLEGYLSERLDISISDTEVLHDGLNLVVAISTPEDGNAYVLRRPNKLRHTSLFNDLKQEYEILGRLRDTGIPAPFPVLFCDDVSVIGDSFVVTSYLDGATIPLGSDLPERFRNPQSRGRVAELLIDILSEIHSLDVEPFEAVCDRQSPREQVALATDRLEETTIVTGRDLPMLRGVADWLQRHAPSDSKSTLVHGDYRPGNVLVAGKDRPEITGVLDWETAMLGDPLTELGYLLLRWRDDNDPTPSLDELAARYPNEGPIQQLKVANDQGLSPFTSKPGSPTRRELVTRYEEQTDIPFENERFYRAHAAFMLATVWEDLHRHRVEIGAESDWEPRIDYLTMMANSIIDGEFKL